ncbi:Alpha-thujene synthase TPS3, chloroplastic [Linum perenne]
MIDVLQRIGLGYHFESEIHSALEHIASSSDLYAPELSLHATALRFRLIRQLTGISISQDIFNKFRDGNGKFKQEIVKDTNGLLELYEASYLAVNGEDIMDEAKAFAIHNLTTDNGSTTSTLGKRVKRALQLPSNWRMQRSDTKWFIELYQQTKEQDTNINELAKLDFNVVQQAHQNELEELTRWWKDLGLIENMEFARDPLLWVDLCRSYLDEARAYHSGSDQKLDQYLNVAWKSVGCDVVLTHGYLSSPFEILSHETLDLVSQSDHELTRLTSIIVRLTNDLASSKGELERGDVVKAVECYMREKQVSEEVAREHMNMLIDETWKKMNEVTSINRSSSLCVPQTYVDLAINVARASHYMYKHGLSSTSKDKNGALSLLFQPL